MLLATPLGASVAPGSAHKRAAALAPCRVAGFLRRGVVETSTWSAQPARRRAATAHATVQALHDTYNAEGGRSVAVTFTLSRKVDFGQQVLLVGDATQLGSWELGNAPHMSWSEGDTWTATVDLPEGADVEYKFVLQSPGHAPVWERCENRHITVDAGTTGTLECDWDVVETRAHPPEGGPVAYGGSSLANGHAAAAAALSAATAALEQKDRAAALQAVQEAAAAAAAVVAAAEATAAAVAKAVQAAENLVAELDGPGVAALGNGAATKGAAASSAQSVSDARYSAEQLDFMRRKLDSIQSMPAVRNGSVAPRSASPRPASPSSRPASPQPAAPSANGNFTPEQLAFLQRKRSASQSPAPSSPPPRPRSSSPAPLRRSSPPPQRPASQRPRSSSPAPQVSAVYAKDVTSYSPEQLEFLRRSGKL